MPINVLSYLLGVSEFQEGHFQNGVGASHYAASQVYSWVLERMLWLIVKPWIQELLFVFCPGGGMVDELFTFSCLLWGAWEFAVPVYMCLVNLEKAYERRRPMSGNMGLRSKSCFHILSIKSSAFSVDAGFR